jgi:hypothetical protein
MYINLAGHSLLQRVIDMSVALAGGYDVEHSVRALSSAL